MARTKANKSAYPHTDPLTEIPADYDASVHTPLTEEDFAEEVQYLYYDIRVAKYERLLADAKEQADLCRKYPKKDVRAKYLEFEKLRASLESLKKELEG